MEIKEQDIPSGAEIKNMTALIAYEKVGEEGRIYLTITEKLFKEDSLKSTITFCKIEKGEFPEETVMRSMKKIGKIVDISFVRDFYWKDESDIYKVYLYTGIVTALIAIPKKVVAGDVTKVSLFQAITSPEVTNLSQDCIKMVFVPSKS
mgnify:CR=1 FL=1|jgi:hypothetical protein